MNVCHETMHKREGKSPYRSVVLTSSALAIAVSSLLRIKLRCRFNLTMDVFFEIKSPIVGGTYEENDKLVLEFPIRDALVGRGFMTYTVVREI
jgi:hypothetical protein